MAYKVIGITGLPCSGKSEVAMISAENGSHIINADHVGHAIIEEKDYTRQIAECFGKEVLTPDHKINRKALGAIVFNDPRALKNLEALIHPVMSRRILKEAKTKREHQPVVIDAALLHTMSLDSVCDIIILIEAEITLRKKRALERGWNYEDLRNRDQLLQPEIKFNRKSAHLIVPNNGSMDNLRKLINHFWKEQINGNR